MSAPPRATAAEPPRPGFRLSPSLLLLALVPLSLALEYVGSPVWKGSTRIEVRDAASQQSLLHTVGLASRVSKEWSALARAAGERRRQPRFIEHVYGALGHMPRPLFAAIGGTGHRVMQRRQLQGIKQRAEA